MSKHLFSKQLFSKQLFSIQCYSICFQNSVKRCLQVSVLLKILFSSLPLFRFINRQIFLGLLHSQVPRVIGLFSQRESVGALLMRSACSESCRSTLLGSLEIARKCFEFSCAASPRQNLLFLLV